MAAHESDVAAAKEIAFVPAHLDGGRRPSDFGVVAGIDGAAAWARDLPAEANPFHMDEHSPVVTIVVRDGVRGKGVKETVRSLLDEAAARSVRLRETNSAMRFYDPAGFRRVPGQEAHNRIGTRLFGVVPGEGSADP